MATRPTERRSTSGTVELRGATTEGGLGAALGGYALKYGTFSQNLGGFIETIEPGCIDDQTVRGERGDVLCRYQHEDTYLLGRLVSGTLRLAGDTTGLDYTVDLPDTDYGANVRALAARGDLRYSSFAFRTIEDDWQLSDQGFPLRILQRAQLVDVAPVVSPAYLDTSTGLRSLAEKRGLDLDTVERAAKANGLGELIRAQAPVVLDLGAPVGATATTTTETPGQGDTQPVGRSVRLQLATLGARRK